MKTFQQNVYAKLGLIINILVSLNLSCMATDKNASGEFCSLTRPGAILTQREVRAITDCYVEYARKWGLVYRKGERFKYYQVNLWFSSCEITNYNILINGDVNASLDFDKEYVNYYLFTQQLPRITIIDNGHLGEGNIYHLSGKSVTAYPLYDTNLFGWDTSQIIMTFIDKELVEIEVYCVDTLADVFLGESVLSQYILPHIKLIVHYSYE